ncbi:MAG: DUF1585 domain-containing protein [Myxococcota bacterium]
MMLSLLAACGGVEPGSPYVTLGPVQHAVRASLALRGVRPTPSELAQVEGDPASLDALIDQWAETPEFGLTAKDMFAEWLLVRADVIDPLPALGPMEGRLMHEMSFSLSEAPLELVRHVVDHDLPLTEVVTSEIAMADPVVAGVYGLPYDPEGEPWQVSRWVDGRPAAGLVVDSELWRRHESAGSNFNRRRANLVADVFLCSDFATRDVVVSGGVTISDEFEVAAAVRTQPECVNCHQALDPLATHFFGFKKQVKRTTVNKGYRYDCDPSPQNDPFRPYAEEEFCYPLEVYSTEDEDWWEYWDLPAPGYYGRPEEDLRDLGRSIAEDPRFSKCMARRFYGYLTQSDPAAVPESLAQELQQVLVSEGYSARALAKAVVRTESFRATRLERGRSAEVAPAGIQIVRPEQLARSVEQATGFVWMVNPDFPGCDADDFDGTDCWGQVDLMRSDRFGYRAMAGGIDGSAITRPIHSPTPPRELVWERFAGEAAGFVVDGDFATDRASRRLLTEVEPTDTDRASVERQISAWVPLLHGRFAEPTDPVVQALADLWQAELDRSDGTVERAWALVLTAMWIDPDSVFY